MKPEPNNSSDDEDNDFKNSRLARRNFSRQDFWPKSLLVRSAIRKINLHNPEEIQRISLIDKDQDVLRYMIGGPLNHEEIIEFATESREKNLYAVVGSELVPPEEKNKMQGWIMVCQGREVSLRAVRALGKKVLKTQRPILEVSYAKYPNALPGQMANGLRLVLLGIARGDGLDLLQSNYYHQRLVTAYIDSDNLKSRHVAEAAGFAWQEKRIFWNLENSPRKDLVYILDWQKLRQKLTQQEYG